MKHVACFVLAVMVAGTMVGCGEKPASHSVQPTAPPATSSSSEASSQTTSTFVTEDPPMISALWEKMDTVEFDASLAPTQMIMVGHKGSAKVLDLPITGNTLVDSGIQFRFSAVSRLSNFEFLSTEYTNSNSFETLDSALYIEDEEYCEGWKVTFGTDDEFSGTFEEFIRQDKAWTIRYDVPGLDTPVTFADVFGGDNTQIIDPFTALDAFGEPTDVVRFSSAFDYPQYVYLYDYGDWAFVMQFKARDQEDGTVVGRLDWAGYATSEWLQSYLSSNEVVAIE